MHAFLFFELPVSRRDAIVILSDHYPSYSSNNSIELGTMFIVEGIISSWSSLLQSLWKALGFEGKEGSLLLLGLDNAGM